MGSIVKHSRGFSLIELIVIIVVLGILATVAMQSMTASVDDARRVETEREMDMLAEAIVGNASLYSGGARSDFGYVGDIGSFPPDLRALSQNPGGYSTWNGPYIPAGFVEDTTGYRLDAWGAPYQYSGGIVIASDGGGSTITKKIAKSTADYLSNTLDGIIKDANDSVPGRTYMDSVDITMSIPDGIGGLTTRTTIPDSAGNFTLTALPVGTHPVSAIFRPANDTLVKYITILPRNKSNPPPQFRFASAYFSSTSPCAARDTIRPTGSGSRTELAASGCADNWQCLAESVSDENSSYVESPDLGYAADLYQLADPADTSCVIRAVTVCIRARRFVKTAFAKVTLMTHGNLYEGPEEALVDDFDDYTKRWTINPATGLPWTWAEIEDLDIGVSLRATKSTHPPRCTQAWAIIERMP